MDTARDPLVSLAPTFALVLQLTQAELVSLKETLVFATRLLLRLCHVVRREQPGSSLDSDLGRN